MMGRVFDRFVQSSEAVGYMNERTTLGAGTLVWYRSMLQYIAVAFVHTQATPGKFTAATPPSPLTQAWMATMAKKDIERTLQICGDGVLCLITKVIKLITFPRIDASLA